MIFPPSSVFSSFIYVHLPFSRQSSVKSTCPAWCRMSWMVNSPCRRSVGQLLSYLVSQSLNLSIWIADKTGWDGIGVSAVAFMYPLCGFFALSCFLLMRCGEWMGLKCKGISIAIPACCC
ncbi:hypothetical protein BKA80DRAFT_258720 [Phyllosticta citrichinensis]